MLHVRPGQYGPFTIDQKRITVLGGPGVEISSFVAIARVENLLVGQQVTLQGLLFRSAGTRFIDETATIISGGACSACSA